MSIPTPEQAQELVDYFGSSRAAGQAVGVRRGTVWYWLNPEKGRALQRRHYAANPEKRREANRAWREANPERYAELNRRNTRDFKRRRKERGLCIACGKPGLSESYCWDCLNKQQEANRWRH
jgi:hypothetical protein